jgi:hypothetical protein
MATTNPFEFGRELSPEELVDREDDVDALVDALDGDALAVNDSGDAVGLSESMSSLGKIRSVAILMRAANQWRAEVLRARAGTGAINNDIAEQSNDINNHRDIVGSGTQGAFVWSQGRLTVLSHVVTDPDWVITAGRRINNRGQILAQGSNTRLGLTGVVLLDPPK